jgi:hypothetical protein
MLVVSVALSADADVDAFNDWYDRSHLPEIAACPGFHGATRYACAHGEQEERLFIALYSVDGPEALETEEFAARRGFGAFAQHLTFTTRLYHRLAPLRAATT